MSVGEFLQHTGGRSLDEMSYRVAISNDLEMSLVALTEIPARELDDWILLYAVEAEERASQVENERRRKGR